MSFPAHWREFYWRALVGDFTGFDAPGAPWPGFYAVRHPITRTWLPCAIAPWGQSKVGILTYGALAPLKEGVADPAELWWADGCWQFPILPHHYQTGIALGSLPDPRTLDRFLARTPAVLFPDVSQMPPIPPR